MLELLKHVQYDPESPQEAWRGLRLAYGNLSLRGLDVVAANLRDGPPPGISPMDEWYAPLAPHVMLTLPGCLRS